MYDNVISVKNPLRKCQLKCVLCLFSFVSWHKIEIIDCDACSSID